MLQHWLNPIQATAHKMEHISFISTIYSDKDDFPDISGYNVAIIGASEIISKNFLKGIQLLKNHHREFNISYLGSANQNNPVALQPVFTELMNSNIIPIYIGGNSDDFIMVHKSEPLSVVSSRIIRPHFGQHFISNIGYQRHINHLDDLLYTEQHTINSIGLGKIRSQADVFEAILKDTHCAFIDADVLRSCDFPSQPSCLPTGISAEEFCQIGKYIGLSSHLKSIWLGGFKNDLSDQEWLLLGSFIWYMVEGIKLRHITSPSDKSKVKEYVVTSNTFSQDLIFIKHIETNEMWLKVASNNGQNEYLSCSPSEYNQVLEDDIPDRLFKYIAQKND